MVLLGPPGVGKGTQANYISEWYQACQLSTGDVFRAARCCKAEELSPVLRMAVEMMNRGDLVSDDTVIGMVEERSHCLGCHYGFLLDGYPRTVPQAEALDEVLLGLGLSLDAVINYTLDEEEVVRRLSGRLTCRTCNRSFHREFNPPDPDQPCADGGCDLYQRDDDQPESIRTRLRNYHASTEPLEAYYAAQGLLLNIPADAPPAAIFKRTQHALEKELKV
jgi:adenylate kinase